MALNPMILPSKLVADSMAYIYCLKKQVGFTLLELLITLVIVGILVGLGVPAMSDWIQRSQVRAETQRYVGVLSTARATAIAKNQVISVSAAGNVDGGVDLLVFQDTGGEGNEAMVTADETLISSAGEVANLIVTVMPNGVISFDGSGRLMGGQTVQITVQDQEASLRRVIDVSLVGRTTVSES